MKENYQNEFMKETLKREETKAMIDDYFINDDINEITFESFKDKMKSLKEKER
jgi:hypothetical protein